MSSWVTAPAGKALIRDVNKSFPDRDKRSDGIIGDASHSARPSDHNPDRTWAKNLYVRAVDIDITPDGNPNLDLRTLLIKAAIKDRRTYYVISNGVIYSRTRGFQPRKYNGSNPHNGHVHISLRGGIGDRNISVATATKLNNDTTVWDITSLAAAPAPVKKTRVSPTLRANMLREHQLIGILNTWKLTPYRRQVFTQELKEVKDVLYAKVWTRADWEALGNEIDSNIRRMLDAGQEDKAKALTKYKKRFDHVLRNNPRF